MQVPARQAAARDELRIAAWRKETWPAVKAWRRTWALVAFDAELVEVGGLGGVQRLQGEVV